MDKSNKVTLVVFVNIIRCDKSELFTDGFNSDMDGLPMNISNMVRKLKFFPEWIDSFHPFWLLADESDDKKFYLVIKP